MNNKTAVITVYLHKTGKSVDLEVPLDISANDLCTFIFRNYIPGQFGDMQRYYLKAERPIALLRGERTLREFGIRNGSIINITR